MEFHVLLNQYCEEIGCTNQKLAELSGLSKSLIGRYKRGERIADINGDSLKKLSDGLAKASLTGKVKYEAHNVYAELQNSLSSTQEINDETSKIFSYNLNYCMDNLHISNVELSRYMHIDASMISRIRRGQRRVKDIDRLTIRCAQYVFTNRLDKCESILVDMLSCEASEFKDEHAFINKFSTWLQGSPIKNDPDISGFLDKLDAFDLNEYIKAIKFDELKIPTMPITIPTSKKYYGIDGMRQGTIDFLKATALGGKTEAVTLYNDLSMSELAEDMEFGKKWMFGVAVLLKKGLHINNVHCLDRPFHELMLGLESWIPLYMTGQISPYYLKGQHNSVFCKAYWSSGSAVLTGECVAGHIADGMYAVSKKEIDINYGIKRANNLLERAHPLMDIYRKEDEGRLFASMHNIENQGLNRKGILCCPPLYTISEELLKAILQRNSIDEKTSLCIMERVASYKENVLGSLEGCKISDILRTVSEESFKEAPVKLHLANINVEQDISYTFDEYSRHLKQTEEFASDNINYSIELTTENPFANIQIIIYGEKTVCLSKNNPPIINFVIKYPKLVEAFNDMVLPVI